LFKNSCKKTIPAGNECVDRGRFVDEGNAEVAEPEPQSINKPGPALFIRPLTSRARRRVRKTTATSAAARRWLPAVG